MKHENELTLCMAPVPRLVKATEDAVWLSLTLHQQLAGGLVISCIACVGVLVGRAHNINGQLAVHVLGDQLVLPAGLDLFLVLEPLHLSIRSGHLALQ